MTLCKFRLGGGFGLRRGGGDGVRDAGLVVDPWLGVDPWMPVAWSTALASGVGLHVVGAWRRYVAGREDEMAMLGGASVREEAALGLGRRRREG